MDSIRKSLAREFRDPEARLGYAEEFLNSSIALQIKTLRLQRGWTQEDLADRAGMKQSRISAMERADYSNWSLRTLRRLAEAFDISLSVQFQSYGQFLEAMTSISRKGLEQPSFDQDPAFQDKEESETAGTPNSSPLNVAILSDFKQQRAKSATTVRVGVSSEAKLIQASSEVMYG